MAKLLTTAALKGGVGKSVLTANLAAGLAKAGQKVLLINLDGQNDSLRMINAEASWEKTFYDLIKKGRASVSDCRITLMDGVDAIASGSTMEIDVIIASSKKSAQEILSEILPEDEIAGYDYVLFDLGPGERYINSIILKTAEIIYPVQCEFESIKSLENMNKYLAQLGLSSDDIKLVVPNMLNKSKNTSKMTYQTIKALFPDSKVTKPIPTRADISSAAAFGVNIFDYTTKDDIITPFMDFIMKAIKL